MQFHPAQVAFVADRARYTLAVAGHQGGKTVAAAKAFGERLRELYNERVREIRRGERAPTSPLVNAWVVTPTYELATMPQRYLRGVLGPQTKWRGRMRGIFLECEPWPGCVIKFRSGEHPEKLVSEPVDAMWANETARIKADAWRGNMRMRLTATNGWLLADTTPLGQNWVYEDLYLPSLPPGHPQHDPARYSAEYSSHRWTTADNPAVDPARVEEARRTLPASYFAREFEADFSAFHGQIFPHWRPETNVKRVNLDDYPAVELAADWGFATGHPFVVLVVGVDLLGRRVGVAEEHVHEGLLFERQIELIAQLAEKHPRVRRLTGDSADPGMLAMARARRIGRHVDVVGAVKEAGSVYAGTIVQADLIGEGRYVVDPSCKVTIKQHINARWKAQPGVQGAVTEEVLRMDDDTVAAMRYLVYPRIGHARTRKAA